MDNAGDWLYIVFLIIAGISGLFGSKNKKKRSKQVLGQPDRDIITDDTPQKGFWEVLQEMQNPAPTPKPLVEPRRPRKQPVAGPAPFLSAETTTVRQAPAQNRIVSPSVEEESPAVDIEFDNAAELRKAVIYAEILNRKY